MIFNLFNPSKEQQLEKKLELLENYYKDTEKSLVLLIEIQKSEADAKTLRVTKELVEAMKKSLTQLKEMQLKFSRIIERIKYKTADEQLQYAKDWEDYISYFRNLILETKVGVFDFENAKTERIQVEEITKRFNIALNSS